MAADVESNYDEMLKNGTRRAQTLLDKLQFSEAQTVYHDVLRLAAGGGQCEAAERATVTAVSGLAESFARQSRSQSCTSDDDERRSVTWLRLQVQALSLYRDASDICRRALQRPSISPDDVTFFKDSASLASSRSKTIEETLVAAVERQLRSKNGLTARYMTISNSNRGDGDGGEWLRTVLSRCSKPSSDRTDVEDVATVDTTSASSSSTSSLTAVESVVNRVETSTTVTTVRRRRINFDQIQTAIKQLVNDASSDVRAQYGHLLSAGAVNQTLLQRRVASELMVRLAGSGAQGHELDDVLRESIMYEEECGEDRTVATEQQRSATYFSNSSDRERSTTEATVDESTSDSDTDADAGADDDYETITLDCEAITQYLFGHVVSDVSKSTSARAHWSTENGYGLVDKPETKTEDINRGLVINSASVTGLNSLELNNKDRIIVVWRSYNHEEREPEPEVDEGTDHMTQCASLTLPCCEEMSSVTERGLVYGWLGAGDEAIPTTTDSECSFGLLSTSRLSQTVACLSLQVAAKLRAESRLPEAYDTYRYALELFEDHPPVSRSLADDVADGQRTYCKLVAGLLRDIGVVKCQLGEMAAGCQLLHESAGLYQWMPGSEKVELTVQDVVKVAEVWYQLGSNFLSEDLREDTLLENVMHMIKTELSTSGEKLEYDVNGDDDDDDASFDVRTQDVGAGILDVEESEDSYSVCTHEAVLCYQKALNVLDRSPQTGRLRDQNMPPDLAELYASIYCRLADCYMLTNQLDRAVVTYERSLPYFQLAASGGTMDRRRLLLALNAHALSMLATVNFLLHNFWRASVIYETAMMLHHQLHVDDAWTTLESAWIKTMYGLTFAVLGRDNQCVVWCLRAFAGYVAVLRGEILDVEPLRRWFVVETLYTLARAYTMLEDGPVKAVHYLTVARNLCTTADDDQVDFPQTIEVLDSLAEACESISDVDSAQRYKAEADELVTTFYGSSQTSKPPQDLPDSPTNLTSSREAVVSPRDPGSLRRFIGVEPPSSPPTDGDAVSDTAIREGVASMILRLGLATPGPDEIEDSWSIRQAERDLQETVTKTGGADVIGLSIASQPAPSTTDVKQNSLPSGLDADRRPALSSKSQTSSVTSHLS